MRELKLVAPLVVMWFLVWLPLMVFEDIGLKEQTQMICTLALAVTGMGATILWCSLYGKFGVGRIAIGLFVMVGAAWLTNELAADDRLQNAHLIVGVFFVGLLGFIPGWCLRRFLQWQIGPRTSLDFTSDRHIRIAEIFWWTAAAAVLLAILPALIEVLFQGNAVASVTVQVGYVVTMCVVIPLLAALAFTSLLAAFHPLVVAIAVPVLAAIIGILATVAVAMFQQESFATVRSDVFPMIFAIYALSGFLLLAAATWLRRQGMYFKVGLINHKKRLGAEKEVQATRVIGQD